MLRAIADVISGQGILGWAPMAAILMAPVHTLFGLHIVRRGVIFIDLAIAQVAALGMAIALAQGHDVHSSEGYWISLGFALGGAFLIAVSRFKLGRVPHEAMIGIYFVAASALSIIVLQNTAHGVEEMRDLLTGNIMFVEPEQVKRTAWIYLVLVAVLAALWRPITAISHHEPGAARGFLSVFLDFTFYSLLAFVVASSVQIAGVLLVFTWLVMPAVAVYFWLSRMGPAVAWAVPLSIVMSLAGLWASAQRDWPTGATMVVVLTAVVAVSYLARLLVPSRPRGDELDAPPDADSV